MNHGFFNKYIISSKSTNMFFCVFLSLLLSMLLTSNNFLTLTLISLSSIIFALRIYIRRTKIKNLVYYDINSADQKQDRLLRSYQIGDSVAMIICFTYSLLFFTSTQNKFFNSFGVLIFIAIYFGAAAYSIYNTKINTILKTITVLLSTLQGLVIVKLSIELLIELGTTIINVLYGVNNYNGVERVISIFDYSNIINFCYLVESDSVSTMLVTVVSTLLSTILYVIFIKSVPAYQLKNLSLAFSIVSLIIAVLSVIIYFFIDINYPFIQKFIENMGNDLQSIQIYFGSDIPDDFVSFVQGFNSSKITNLEKLVFLPYTISILIAGLVITIENQNNSKKKDFALHFIAEAYENNKLNFNNKLLEYNKKAFLYYGGNKNEIKLMEKVHILESILNEYQNDEV